MNRCVVALSPNPDEKAALDEVCATIDRENSAPLLIVFFSQADTFYFFTTELKQRYGGSTVIGSVSSVNFSSEGIAQKGLSALAVYSGFEVAAGMIFDVDRHPLLYLGHIQKAMAALSSFENTCCLEFTSSFSNGEELVLDTFSEAFAGTGITVFGGSSGDIAKTTDSGLVSLDGVVYQNTCVFVLLHNLNGRITFFHGQNFRPMNMLLTATEVDCERRVVYEYNNRPAADVLADFFKVSLAELPAVLETHPLGRFSDGTLFIADAGNIFPDGSILYYSRIYGHTKMAVLEPEPLEAALDFSEKDVRGGIAEPAFAICINCCARSSLFEKNNVFGTFVENLTAECGTFIGLSGYGEQLKDMHFNRAMVLAVFE